MKDFLKTLISRIVSSPDDVLINVEETEFNIVFNIRVHADDYGKVIGKKGRMIESVRNLLYLFTQKKGEENKKRMVVKMSDET